MRMCDVGDLILCFFFFVFFRAGDKGSNNGVEGENRVESVCNCEIH